MKTFFILIHVTNAASKCFNAGYHLLDLVPKARDEDSLPFPQAWVRYRDSYEISRGA